MSFTFPKIILRKIAWICYGVQLCLLRMMRWLAYQSWSPIVQESDKIIGNHFDIWHSQLTEYIHINLWCGFWQGGVHESLQIRMWSNSTKQNLSDSVYCHCHLQWYCDFSNVSNTKLPMFLCVFVQKISRAGHGRATLSKTGRNLSIFFVVVIFLYSTHTYQVAPDLGEQRWQRKAESCQFCVAPV